MLRDTGLPLGRWLNAQTAILLSIFILFYFFRIASFTISIDDEFGAVRESPNVWLLQGRWAVYLLERFVVTHQVLPFFPFIVFGACLAISYRIFLSTFGVDRLSKVDYLTFALYAGYPIWMFSLSFFSNAIAFGLGQLFAIASIYHLGSFLASRERNTSFRQSVAPMLYACVLGAVAIGMYQSYVFLIASLGFGLIVVRILQENSGWRRALIGSTWIAVGVLLSIAVYEMVQQALLAVTQLGSERYVANFLDWHSLRNNPLQVVYTVIVGGLQAYGGSAEVFGVTLLGFAAVVILGFASTAFWPGLSWRSRSAAIVLLAVLAALPFLLHLAAGGRLPARTLVAVPAVVWLLARLSVGSSRRILSVLGFCAITVSAVQSLYALNLLQTANVFARAHDEALASAIYEKIISIDADTRDGHAPVLDFSGAKEFVSIYPRPTPATMGYSFFEWDGGNSYRIVAYLHLLGYPSFEVANQQQRREDDVVFRDMPSWPAPGSVRSFKGVVLIKLGPKPGFR